MQPFIGEVRIWANSFAPLEWAYCDGQYYSPAQWPALFSVIGNAYGGNGVSNFRVPNLKRRVPMSWGQGPGLMDYNWGEMGGQEAVTLLPHQIPSHTHTMMNASGNVPIVTGSTNDISNNFWAIPQISPAGGGFVVNFDSHVQGSDEVTMDINALAKTGGGQAHENRQPYLAMPFCIALDGVYPNRN